MRIITSILFLLFTCSLFGQVEKSSKKSEKWNGVSKQVTLDDIDLTDTEKAISDISVILNQATQNNDNTTIGECYVLLATVYDQINEYDLSIGRRKTALTYFKKGKNQSKVIEQYYALGKLHTKTNNLDISIQNFNLCLEVKEYEKIKLKCKEGLADVYLLQGKSEESITYYNDLDEDYGLQNQPQSNARIKIKKAKAYADQNDNLNALDNYRRGSGDYTNEATEEDLAVLEEAKEEIIKLEPAKELPVRRQNVVTQSGMSNAGPNIAMENLKISKTLIEKGDLDKAEELINTSLNSNSLDPSITKDFYKISSDINAKKGNYEKALEDFSQYQTLSKVELETKANEQNKLVEILKGQRLIDIKNKDLTIKSNRVDYDTSLSQGKNWIIGLLGTLLLGALIAFFIIYRNIKERKKANQLLLLKSLRAQMNPHFIFNVLNSINNYISKNDERSANKYLSEFSKLMRKVLQDSQKDLISLEDELEMTSIYLNLEHKRFPDKFDYDIKIDDEIDLKEVFIPPMMIQPFIENAVWHGMRYKKTKGSINLAVTQTNQGVNITITDNGIGRVQSKALKTANQQSYQSTGLKNVQSRLKLVNEIYGKSFEIGITDFDNNLEDTGTSVTLNIKV